MLDKKAYTEAFYIINEMPDEMRNKIPKDVVDNIKSKMDNDYKFNIENNDFDNVELLEDTEKILSVLYTDYLSTVEEKEVILNMEKILNKHNNKNISKLNSNVKVNDIFENHDKSDKKASADIESNNKLVKNSFKEWIRNLINKFIKIFINKE